MNNKLNSMTPSRVIRFLIGDDNVPTFHRVHHTFLMVSFCFYVFAGLFNTLFLHLYYLFNIAFITLGFFQIVIWYYSRFKNHFRSMAILYIALHYLFIIPANWFFNAGSQGPTFAYLYLAVIYSVFVFSELKVFNAFVVLILLGVPSGLLIIEYYYPIAILGYSGAMSRLTDLVINYFISIAILITVVVLYTRALKREVRRANSYSRQLQLISETDGLTQLKNRSYCVNALRRIEAENKNFNVIILDIDHFKNINDTYGHDVGDIVLKKVSNILKMHSQMHGALLSRYGGEEFLVITFFQSFDQTIYLAESLRNAISRAHYGLPENVTISLGVAKSVSNEEYSNVIKRADQALYHSKHIGRNSVSTFAIE